MVIVYEMACVTGLALKNLKCSGLKQRRRAREGEEGELARSLNNAYKNSDNMEDEGGDFNAWYSPVARKQIPKGSTSIPSEIQLKSSIQPTPSKRKPKRKVRIMDADTDDMSHLVFEKDHNNRIDFSDPSSMEQNTIVQTTYEPSRTSLDHMLVEREELRDRLRKEREKQLYNIRISLQLVAKQQLQERKIKLTEDASAMKDCELGFSKVVRACARNVFDSSGSNEISEELPSLFSSQINHLLRKYKDKLNEEIEQEKEDKEHKRVTCIINELGCINSANKQHNLGNGAECRKIEFNDNNPNTNGESTKNLVQIEKLNALCEYILNGFTLTDDGGNLDTEACIEKQRGIEGYLQMRLSDTDSYSSSITTM